MILKQVSESKMGKIKVVFCSIKIWKGREVFKQCVYRSGACVYVSEEEKKTTKCCTYMYSQDAETQLGYLPSCPPRDIQNKALGASFEMTEIPSIHNSIEAQLPRDLENF